MLGGRVVMIKLPNVYCIKHFIGNAPLLLKQTKNNLFVALLKVQLFYRTLEKCKQIYVMAKVQINFSSSANFYKICFIYISHLCS